MRFHSDEATITKYYDWLIDTLFVCVFVCLID